MIRGRNARPKPDSVFEGRDKTTCNPHADQGRAGVAERLTMGRREIP